jgi:small-conductance mechanosensitive channel
MAKRLCGLLLLLSVTVLAGRAFADVEPPAESPGDSESALGLPVRLAGEEAFRIYDPQGAEETVSILEERLLRIARDPFYSDDLLTLDVQDDGVFIRYRDARVFFVDTEAAARAGTSPKRRAAGIVTAVDVAVERYRDRQEPEEWTRALALLALATGLLAGAIWLVMAVHRRVAARLEARSRAGLSVGGQRLGYLSTTRLLTFQRRAFLLARTVLSVFLVLVYLQSAFTILPLTRGYALGMIAYVIDPLRFVWDGVLQNVGDVFFIIVITFLARLVLRGIRLLLTEAASGSVRLPGVPQDRALPLYKVARLFVIAMTMVMIYPYIPGSGTAAFQGISLFAGALFTLGASSTASNFIGGIMLIFSGSFRIGDRIRIGDVVGDVVESTLALTRLRTAKNEVVTFANGAVLNQNLVNYSDMARKEGLILHTAISIGYDVPWRQVHDLLVGAALRAEHVLEEPAPFVLQTSLNDFHVGYQINAYTHAANRMASVLGELHQNIQDAFSEAGIEILSPAYTALRDGAADTIPAHGATGASTAV